MPHPPLAAARRRPPLFAEDRKAFDRFLAGQLAALRELTLFYAPNVNSYKRFASESFAPTAVAWGPDNRTCSVRVVGHGAGIRAELRLPGADVNPYLALSAMIAAGLHGMDGELELEAPIGGNAYASDKPRVPGTLRDARDLFADSAVAREAFGEEVVEHYLNNAQVELDAFDVRGHRLGALPRLRAALNGRLRGLTSVRRAVIRLAISRTDMQTFPRGR